jgi:hypothetical protein
MVGKPEVSAQTKKKKPPRGVHWLPDGRLPIYATHRGKPVRLTVTWDLLAELKVPVPPTRLEHPGLELAQRALVKLRGRILEEERTGIIEATDRTRIGDLLELMEQDYLREGRKTSDDVACRWKLHLRNHFADLRAGELNSCHINAYIFQRQREGASRASINRELAVVERMLHLGERTTASIQGKGNDDYAFTRDDGEPIRDFRDEWTKMFAAAGVEGAQAPWHAAERGPQRHPTRG